MEKENVYFSFDVEADGPSPCRNSMMSLGVALLDENKTILNTWECNFKPLDGHVQDSDTMEWWAKKTKRHMNIAPEIK